MISTCALQLVDAQPELARELRHLVVLQQPQVLGDDLLGRRALEAQVLDLQRQALLQVARGDADRVEALDQAQRLLDVLDRPRAHRRDLVHRGHQVAVVVEVADDGFADLADRFGVGLERQLPFEVVGQRRAGRERVLDRRQLLDLLRRARAVAVVQVVAEEVLVVGVVPGVGLVGLGLELALFFGGRGHVGGLEVLGRDLFEQRVLDDLLVEEVGEFQGRHWQQLDRLLERRRQNQLLCELRLKLLLNGH